MNETYSHLPRPTAITEGQRLLIHEEVFGDAVHGAPGLNREHNFAHLGLRRSVVLVAGPSFPGAARVKVVASEGACAHPIGSELDKYVANLLAGYLVDETLENGRFKAGGYLAGVDGSGKKVVLDEADRGGLGVGASHANGGIQATVGPQERKIEFEGQEIVMCPQVAASTRTYQFEGTAQTPRAILSRLNQDAGGVAFAQGGVVVPTFQTGGQASGGEGVGTHQHPIEFSGEEIILTAPVTSSTRKYQFEGAAQTPRQIASRINQDHGGVAF